MLPRSHRLRHTKHIQHTLRSGTCFATPYLKICFVASASPDTRIACVVGKSVHRSAVWRHRYQRWLREVARRLLKEQPLPRAYDMVWIAQPSILQADSISALFDTLVPRWQKLRDTL